MSEENEAKRMIIDLLKQDKSPSYVFNALKKEFKAGARQISGWVDDICGEDIQEQDKP